MFATLLNHKAEIISWFIEVVNDNIQTNYNNNVYILSLTSSKITFHQCYFTWNLLLPIYVCSSADEIATAAASTAGITFLMICKGSFEVIQAFKSPAYT